MSTRGERAAKAASRWIDTEGDHERMIADELTELLCEFAAAEAEKERIEGEKAGEIRAAERHLTHAEFVVNELRKDIRALKDPKP